MRARLFLLILPLLLASCGRRPTDGATEGDTLRLRHASLLTVVRTDSFTQVDVADPWHEGHTLRRYLLVGAGRPLPHGLPEGTVVRTPLRRAVAFSTVHASLMAELHALDGLAAVCDSRYVVSPALRRALDSGRLADGGSSMTPDAERLLALRPDALLWTNFAPDHLDWHTDMREYFSAKFNLVKNLKFFLQIHLDFLLHLFYNLMDNPIFVFHMLLLLDVPLILLVFFLLIFHQILSAYLFHL